MYFMKEHRYHDHHHNILLKFPIEEKLEKKYI